MTGWNEKRAGWRQDIAKIHIALDERLRLIVEARELRREVLKGYGLPLCSGCSRYLDEESVTFVEGAFTCFSCGDDVVFLDEDEEKEMLCLDTQAEWAASLDDDQAYIEQEVSRDAS